MYEERIKLSQLCDKYPFIVFYQGDYRQTPTESIVKLVERDRGLSFERKRLKVLVYLIIEALQNVERYSSHELSSEDYALIYSDSSYFHICTRNLVKNEKVQDLKMHLDGINGKSREELTQQFNQTISSAISTKHGAGLGLIDIARKTNKQLFYEFESRNDNNFAYTLRCATALNQENPLPELKDRETKDLLHSLKSTFLNNQSTFFYAGALTSSFVISLFKMLKTVKKDEQRNNEGKIYHLLMELALNAKKYSLKQNGRAFGQLFAEWNEGKVNIHTYHKIEKKHGKKLLQQLNDLNAMSLEELKSTGKLKLSEMNPEKEFELIAISVLIYPEKLHYELIENSDGSNELFISASLNINIK